MKDQKTLKNIFAQELPKAWGESQRMIDYCYKEAAYVIEFNGGEIATIDKPSVKKDFCYGYGYCGISTEEDENRASRMARKAESDTNYFIDKNMEPLNRWTDQLTNGRYKVYIRPHYTGQTEDCKLVCYELVDPWEAAPKNSRELSQEEIDNIVNGYEEVKKAFMKRLNTYLKRYGLTKVHSWTYLSD